jgi:hypothetical protein
MWIESSARLYVALKIGIGESKTEKIVRDLAWPPFYQIFSN